VRFDHLACRIINAHNRRVKYWEIIADNLSKADWSRGCVSAIDSNGRTIWVADAHRDDGKRFVARANEKLTAFLELESAIWQRVKNSEIIADNLKKAGWTSGAISSTDRNGRQFWVVATQGEDAGRFIVRADEKLRTFLELEAATRKATE